MLKKYGPYGPQGPWTMGPMGPRGLWAQITKKLKFFKILQKLLLRTSIDP